MFWTLPRFREIGIRVLQHRFLIAMPELVLQTAISWRLVIISFYGTFCCVLIWFVAGHDFTSLLIQFIVAKGRLHSL